jgi:hypothetical protein
MEELDKREKENRNHSTQGWEKLWNYFIEISRKEYFQKKIAELRKEYKIPKRGYKCSQTYTTPPAEWQSQFRGLGQSYITERVKILDELKAICEKYNLHYVDWVDIIEDYLFYNELVYIMDDNAYNLCLLSDLVNNKRKAFSKDFKGSDDQFYPIAIRISPYASERDILDYVKKMAPLIKEFQKPYIKPDVKIGKVKRKKHSTQKRNDFIWKNKDLRVAEIKAKLDKEFPDNKIMGYEEIYTIISLEKKRRTAEF